MAEVCTRSHSDFEYFPFSDRDNLPPNFADRFRVTESVYQMRINIMFIERHGQSSSTPRAPLLHTRRVRQKANCHWPCLAGCKNSPLSQTVPLRMTRA
jgi:hypothetical protein